MRGAAAGLADHRWIRVSTRRCGIPGKEADDVSIVSVLPGWRLLLGGRDSHSPAEKVAGEPAAGVERPIHSQPIRTAARSTTNDARNE